MVSKVSVSFMGAIVAAGHGERLRRSGAVDLPKPLVEIDGETMLARQARVMLAAGAHEVLAIVNSETAATIKDRRIPMPSGLRLMVRDTANSMESLLALGEQLSTEKVAMEDALKPAQFLLATVDAVIAPHEFARFTEHALAMTAPEIRNDVHFDGVLAVVKWRGDTRPLFADVTSSGLIARLGGTETQLVTAGIYLLPTRIFGFAADERRRGLDAMRKFLAMLIENGVRLGALELEGAIDVDEGADLAAARAAAAGRGRGEEKGN